MPAMDLATDRAAPAGPTSAGTPAPPAKGDDRATVRLAGVSKFFRRKDGTEVRALDEVYLSVTEGEFVVLLGPSGCGKTTLLRCIAGLETPDTGTIDICGSRVFAGSARASTPPDRRSLNMMFQSYALWPHMSVLQNVQFPLRTRRVRRREARERALEVLELIGIADLAAQHPAQLSGGQQQRVALARALVNGDRLILFDEPLSNVDAKVREQLRVELIEMQRKLRFSAIYVTHDQHEAMELAHRLVILQSGRIAQVAPPNEVYDRPVNRYVANFVGTANELSGSVVAVSPDVVRVRTPVGELSCPPTAAGHAVDDEVVVIWRPEAGEIGPDPDTPHGPGSGWEGRVHASMFASGQTTVVVEVAGQLFRVVQTSRDVPPEGSAITIRVPHDQLRVLPRDREDGVPH